MGGRARYGGCRFRPLPICVGARTVKVVDNRAEIREFLASRRAKVTPEQVGLPAGGGKRRVPGLRREEVAVLAGVSTDWYTRLEKGHINGVSADVLDAVARALQLDEAERTHLFNLARAARPDRTPRRRGRSRVRPSVQRILDSMVTTPAFVRNGRLDLLAINALGRALFSPAFEDPTAREPRPVQLPRPGSGRLLPGLEQLRQHHRRPATHRSRPRPHNKDLADLIGELATRSDAFRVRWAAHDVRLHRSGVKHFHHPVVGTVELLRGHGSPRRPRTHHHRLHRRARLPFGGRAQAARLLVRHRNRHRVKRCRPGHVAGLTSALYPSRNGSRGSPWN